MPKIAINLKKLGFNITILAEDYYLSGLMNEIQKFLSEMIKKQREDFPWEFYAPFIREDLVPQYEFFLENPLLRNNDNAQWMDFVTSLISYFFTYSYMKNIPIKLVHIDSFEKAISKGIYVNLTNGDKPDLVEGIDYIKYVRV